MAQIKNVLFICTGNVCRSPMAEALFRTLVEGRDDFVVSSAGVSAGRGQSISRHSAEILRDQGIKTEEFRSQPLTSRLVREATHIFSMTRGHLHVLESLFPEASEKSYLVCEFCEIAGKLGMDVPDPIGLGREAYEVTFEALQKALPTVLKYIEDTTKAQEPALSPSEMPAPTPSPSEPSKKATTRIALAADHGGFALKEALVAYLKKTEREVEDLGTTSKDSVDYPDYGHLVARAIQHGKADLGILVCTSGVGMSMVANRHPGIRAAVVFDPAAAALTREHNGANVLCLSGDKTDPAEAEKIVEAFLAAEFGGGRHQRRVDKMEAGILDELAIDGVLSQVDPAVAEAIREERVRQTDGLELIASENFASAAVRAAQGSVLTNKYAEGYPGRRWYGGCENVDVVEQLAIDRAKQLFGADHANVQPHAGSQANMAVYFSVLEPGDKILAMNLAHGGHLTHGHPMNFSGRFYQIIPYGVAEKDERIDYDALEQIAQETKPKMITAGASAYPRIIDFERMGKIAKSVGAYLFVDMAHIAGLVAGGVHPSPVPYADFVTTTTHKSLRGPRSGLILCREEHAKKIDSQVFPGIQGGPLMHVIAAKAVCFHEALQPSFKEYQKQLVINAEALANALVGHGFRLVSGGTDNHLMLIDLRTIELNGKVAQETLDQVGITVNKNSIPFDTLPPAKGGGIRLGTPAVTTRGMKEAEMKQIADWIHQALVHRQSPEKLAEIRSQVREMARRYPLP